jgi:hypothetical protein
MKRRTPALGIALGLLGLAACSNTVGPGVGLLTHYTLTSVDGVALPAPTSDLPEGWVVELAQLEFPRDRPRGAGSFVWYIQLIRGPDNTTNLSRTQLEFTVDGSHVSINLCPPLALCIVQTELIGEHLGDQLVLTHYLANQARSLYRFTEDHSGIPE